MTFQPQLVTAASTFNSEQLLVLVCIDTVDFYQVPQSLKKHGAQVPVLPHPRGARRTDTVCAHGWVLHDACPGQSLPRSHVCLEKCKMTRCQNKEVNDTFGTLTIRNPFKHKSTLKTRLEPFPASNDSYPDSPASDFLTIPVPRSCSPNSIRCSPGM